MAAKMTAARAEELIRDGLAERARLGYGYGDQTAEDRSVFGCALCALYAGAGGEVFPSTNWDGVAMYTTPGASSMREFLTSDAVNEAPISTEDLLQLEMGYEAWLVLEQGEFHAKVNKKSAFFKLGSRLRDDRMGLKAQMNARFLERVRAA